MQVLQCRDVVFAFIANAVAMYNVGFFNSFLALELTGTYEIDSADIGYYYMILSIAYLASAIIIPYAFKSVPRKLQFICCFALTSVSMMLMGPSKLFGIPPTLGCVLVGLPMLGFFQALCFIPSLPEAIECYQQKYKIIEGVNPALDNKLNDVLSSQYGLFYNLSSLVGPILGGLFYDKFGYRTTLDINMFLELIILGIFVRFNGGMKLYENDRIF